MYLTDRVYKNGSKERIKVYEMSDFLNMEKCSLFDGDENWDGAAANYRLYLHGQKNRFISKMYRYKLKNALMLKVTNMYFKMVMKDILIGHKIKIGKRALFLFIGNRKSTSNSYDNKKGHVNFIPYITIAKSVTRKYHYRMYYLSFSEKYQKALNSLLRKGKRYIINNE